MKKLISVSEIRALAEAGEKTVYIDMNTLVTAAARDAASEAGMEIKKDCKPDQPVIEKVTGCCDEVIDIDRDRIYKLVKEVLLESLMGGAVRDMDKESDPSGLKLIRGDTVKCDPFETGNPNARVGLKDVVSIKESPNMGAGFMTIEKSSFDWELCYEEFDVIMEGNLDITINGKTYHGKKGDVFFIPKNSKITWSTPDFARFFYVTFPANWAEIAAQK